MRATDAGRSPRTAVVPVIVTIRDLQDNPPLFEEAQFTRSVPENQAGANVMTLIVSS